MRRMTALALMALALAASAAQGRGEWTDAARLFAASSRTLVEPLVYEEPGMFDAKVFRFEYKPGLFADVYRPAGAAAGEALPLVLCASPYSRTRAVERHGVGIIDTSLVVSWNAFLAAGGVAVAAPEISSEAAKDMGDFLAVLRSRASELGVDPDRVALLGSSAGAPQAWSLALPGSPLSGKVRSLAILYGVLSPMSEPPAPGVKLLFVIAGKDSPSYVRTQRGLVESMGKAGVDVTSIEYALGRHGFDASQRGDESTKILLAVREFLVKSLE